MNVIMGNATNLQENGQPTVIRTGRGLTVAGTRITLYAIMDFIKEDYPPKSDSSQIQLDRAADGRRAGLH